MKLGQYYELIVRQQGYHSWNHFCAEVSTEVKEGFKSDLKTAFKNLSWDELELLEEEYNKKVKKGDT